MPHRPAVDVAFAVARWYARGGTFSNYYMAFGGTTFGRQVGGPEIITSYDYDVQINEFGLRAEPKFSLLAQLHSALHTTAPVILSHDSIPDAVPLAGSSTCDSITYDDSHYQSELGCVAFLSNIGTDSACTFDVYGVSVEVPAWSVSVVTRACASTAGTAQHLLNTHSSAAAIPANKVTAKPLLTLDGAAFQQWQEPVPATHTAPVRSAFPPDQLTLTGDSSDYLWISSTLPARNESGTVELSFRVGAAGGAVCYAYVNGALAASTVDTTPVKTASGKALGTRSTKFVAEAAARAAQRTYSEEVAGKGSPVWLTVDVPAGEGARLDLLFASTGIQNYGPYMETVKVGVASEIKVDGVPLMHYAAVPGLNGEQRVQGGRPLMPAAPSALPFGPLRADSSAAQPLSWYRATFATPEGVGADGTSLALDVSTTGLVKGAVWVNDFMLGRYWNIIAGTEGGACGKWGCYFVFQKCMYKHILGCTCILSYHLV